MKKKIITLILCIVSIFAVIISVNFQYADANNSYYSSVEGLEGEELLNALADLTQAKHTNYNTYGEVRYMYEADQDPNNSSNVLDFYSQISVTGAWDGGSTWNREHVWPKALSGGLYTNTDNSDRGAGADIHHLRPTIPNINSSRQDKRYTDFDYIEQNGVENKFNGVLVAYDSTGLWEPLDNVKGDAARILMYLYMHYSTEVEANADFSYAGNLVITNVFYTDEETDEAAWKVLLDWNTLDPVDSFEMKRNEYCYNVTGVYNPFIDHPEYADLIFGETTSKFRVNYSVTSDVIFNYSDKNRYDSGELITLPTATPTRNGYNFIGWTKTNGSQTLWNFETDIITENLTLYPVWEEADSFAFVTDVTNIKCQLAYNYETTTVENVASYTLVKNASELSAGDEIIIVNNASSVAMSTNQKSNNRGTTSVTISNEQIKFLSDEVAVITLETGKVANTFGFKVTDGYLYANGADKNYLRTKSTLDNFGSWSISIDSSSGIATILGQGGNARNWLKFNKSSNLFACYASGQQDVFIYKNNPASGEGYEVSKMDIVYTYEVSLETYQNYFNNYNFGFIVNDEYRAASVIRRNDDIYIITLYVDSTSDFITKYEIVPSISLKTNNNTLYFANVSNNYSVKDLITKYLAIGNSSGLSQSEIDKINSEKAVLNYILNNC